jgi:ATP-dependent Lon protease
MSEAELIPLLTPEREEEMINEELPDSLPIYHYVIWFYPGVVIPITAGRDKSIKLINANAAGENHGVVAQKMSQTNLLKRIFILLEL